MNNQNTAQSNQRGLVNAGSATLQDRPSQITAQMGELQNKSERLRKLASELDSRCAKAILAYPPEPSQNKQPMDSLVPLAEEIRNINDELEATSQILSRLLNAIEL